MISNSVLLKNIKYNLKENVKFNYYFVCVFGICDIF